MPEAKWLAEEPLLGWQQRFQVNDKLFETDSRFQHIEIWDTVPFGRLLVLDGAVQTSEQDEFIYHEMLTHVALLAHPRPRRVLVVGGGDGGCLRRVLEHPVREAVQVEIDEKVVETCLRWLPGVSAGAYDDPRASLVIEDAMLFLDRPGEPFDVILVDSTDPVGAATPLFTEHFYRAVSRRLSPDGILVTQSGSPLLMAAELRRVSDLLRTIFTHVAPYLATIPSYPGVLWSFCASSQRTNPDSVSARTVEHRLSRRGIQTHYFTSSMQRSAFELPSFLREVLGDDRPIHVHAPIRTVPLQSPLN